jgi:hypothetical protein
LRIGGGKLGDGFANAGGGGGVGYRVWGPSLGARSEASGTFCADNFTHRHKYYTCIAACLPSTEVVVLPWSNPPLSQTLCPKRRSRNELPRRFDAPAQPGIIPP